MTMGFVVSYIKNYISALLQFISWFTNHSSHSSAIRFQRLSPSKATSTSKIMKFTALMQATSSPSARSTSSIPTSEPILYKTYSPLGIGLFAIALFLILVVGTALIYYKDRCFCYKRKGDARLRQGTHLAEVTNLTHLGGMAQN